MSGDYEIIDRGDLWQPVDNVSGGGQGRTDSADHVSPSEPHVALLKQTLGRPGTPPSESAKSRTSEILGGISSVLKKMFAVACGIFAEVGGIALFALSCALLIYPIAWLADLLSPNLSIDVNSDESISGELSKLLTIGKGAYYAVDNYLNSTALSQTEQAEALAQPQEQTDARTRAQEQTDARTQELAQEREQAVKQEHMRAQAQTPPVVNPSGPGLSEEEEEELANKGRLKDQDERIL